MSGAIGVLAVFCESHGPTLISATLTSVEPMVEVVNMVNKELREDVTSDCEYCKSFCKTEDWPCFATFMDKLTYISSRGGAGVVDPRFLKHVSMRCLSCELGDTFVVRDDLLEGGILCHNFRAQDQAARGSRRLYSLSLVSLTSSLLSPSSTSFILSRLQDIASELVSEDTDYHLSLAKDDLQKKALTLVHLRFTELMIQMSLERKKFHKTSIIPRCLTTPIRRDDLHLAKACATSCDLRALLNEMFLKRPSIAIKFEDEGLMQKFKDLLSYLSIGRRLMTLRANHLAVLKEGNATRKSDEIVVLSDLSVKVSEESRSKKEIPLLTYVREVLDAVNEGLSYEATLAKISLIKHKYDNLARHWPSKATPNYIMSKGLETHDAVWLESLCL